MACDVKIGDKIANGRLILRPSDGRISRERISEARATIAAQYGVRLVDIHAYAHGDALALYFVKPIYTLVADDTEIWRNNTEPRTRSIAPLETPARRGWNGVVLDLFRDSQWVRGPSVSPEVFDDVS